MRRSALALALLLAPRVAGATAVAHRSETHLPSSNGRAAIAYDTTTLRLTQFLEHPYRFPSAGRESRNFAFDSYPGVRVGSAAAWLPSVTPTAIEYVAGTGIVHAQRSFQGVTVDEYHFAPMSLTENASVMIVQATRVSGTGNIDAFGLFNYHLGAGQAPDANGETIVYSGASDALYEYGASGVAFGYGALGAHSTHHASSPEPFYSAVSGGANLGDTTGTGGPLTDAAAALQASLGNLGVGGSASAGWFTVLAPDGDALAAIARVRTWANGRTTDAVLADEIAAWHAWITPAPASATAREAAIATASQVNLRMGIVTEPGASSGQIVASIAPGKWNIAWVRDMAYATVGLVRTGHLAEARGALAFQMGATAGSYAAQVGAPYQISVVRYFGDGTEESDSNADGPNIEFDGFGLFLWALDEYVRASGDTTVLASWWPVVTTKVADVLTGLQEAGGLIAADTSIWEVHWNQKKHFSFTQITAAHGLCSAARLADALGDTAAALKYRAAGGRTRDALLNALRAPDGTLAQSTETLASGTGWLDAAVLEAFNFGLFDGARHTAKATLKSVTSGLIPPSGRGLMRNDVGAWYDSQEWIFIDLRSARPRALAGDPAGSSATWSWNLDQATENFGELSELHDRVTADYAGESPMVGFGAGSYLVTLTERGAPVVPTCDGFAAEPMEPVDAGGGDAAVDAPSGAADPEAGAPDASPGVASQGDTGGGGCGCRSARGRTSGGIAFVSAAAAIMAARRRRRT